MSARLERERSRFDHWAGWYDRRWFRRRLLGLHHWVLQAIPPAAGNPERILDIGCGPGRLLFLAAQHFPDAEKVGIDISPRMIAVARANAPADGHFRFEVAAADTLPFPAASFDLAFSSISLHHWPDPLAGLREICRVVRPGAYFLLADFSLSGRLGAAVSALGRVFHHSVYSPNETQRLFDEAGFLVREQTRPRSLAWRVIVITAGERRQPE